MNHSDYRISVVVTSFNHKAYLIEAIDSLLQQTVSPYEIIVADDGSTDGSVEVIQDYARRYPDRVRVVLQPHNVGIPKNRNAALKVAAGSHVAILDGDDKVLPNGVETAIEALQSHPGAVGVYSNVRIVGSGGQLISLRDRVPHPSGAIFAYVAAGKFGLLRSLVISRAALQDIGLLDERLPRYDGFDLSVRLAAHGRLVYIPTPLVDYRVHQNSDSTALNAAAHLKDLTLIYSKLEPLLEQIPLTEGDRIRQAWTTRLFRWRFFDAMERRDVGRMLALLGQALTGRRVPLKELFKIARGAIAGETHRSILLRRA